MDASLTEQRRVSDEVLRNVKFFYLEKTYSIGNDIIVMVPNE